MPRQREKHFTVKDLSDTPRRTGPGLHRVETGLRQSRPGQLGDLMRDDAGQDPTEQQRRRAERRCESQGAQQEGCASCAP